MTHPLSPGTLAVVGAGGAAGTLGRYGLTRAFPVAAGSFPTTTLVINAAGAFLLALMLETLARRSTHDHWLRLLLGVGLLGAFTTFSTVATELALLWRGGDGGTAVAYAVASIGAGIGAVLAGLAVAGGHTRPVPDEGET